MSCPFHLVDIQPLDAIEAGPREEAAKQGAMGFPGEAEAEEDPILEFPLLLQGLQCVDTLVGNDEASTESQCVERCPLLKAVRGKEVQTVGVRRASAFWGPGILPLAGASQ